MGEISVGEKYGSGKSQLKKCPLGNCSSGKCQSGNCPVKKLFYNRKNLTMLWAVPLENMFS